MSEEIIECRAVRRGRGWAVHAAEYGVYGHGSTLKRACASVEQGLALIGITAPVRLVAVSPELEELRAADEARTAALVEAVKALSLRRATMGDIAIATDTPRRQVKAILASLKATAPADSADAGSPEPEPEPADGECTCVVNCAEDPTSGCSRGETPEIA
ncbi:hypothetical protein [Streptomyces zaomyceticus]|uniref:hypothetical protein n=1 Tax=Streptomyces zaomyceticus TaxID=68286 RepID=UPI0036CBBB53